MMEDIDEKPVILPRDEALRDVKEETIPCLFCDVTLITCDALEKHAAEAHSDEDLDRVRSYIQFNKRKVTTSCNDSNASGSMGISATALDGSQCMSEGTEEGWSRTLLETNVKKEVSSLPSCAMLKEEAGLSSCNVKKEEFCLSSCAAQNHIVTNANPTVRPVHTPLASAQESVVQKYGKTGANVVENGGEQVGNVAPKSNVATRGCNAAQKETNVAQNGGNTAAIVAGPSQPAPLVVGTEQSQILNGQYPQCSTCKKAFYNLHFLIQHMQRRHGVKSKQKVCTSEKCCYKSRSRRWQCLLAGGPYCPECSTLIGNLKTNLERHVLSEHPTMVLYYQTSPRGVHFSIDDVNVGAPRDGWKVWSSGVPYNWSDFACPMCTFRTKAEANHESKLRAFQHHVYQRHPDYRVVKRRGMVYVQELSNCSPEELKRSRPLEDSEKRYPDAKTEQVAATDDLNAGMKRHSKALQAKTRSAIVLVEDVMHKLQNLPDVLRPVFNCKRPSIRYRCPLCSRSATFETQDSYLKHVWRHRTPELENNVLLKCEVEGIVTDDDDIEDENTDESADSDFVPSAKRRKLGDSTDSDLSSEEDFDSEPNVKRRKATNAVGNVSTTNAFIEMVNDNKSRHVSTDQLTTSTEKREKTLKQRKRLKALTEEHEPRNCNGNSRSANDIKSRHASTEKLTTEKREKNVEQRKRLKAPKEEHEPLILNNRFFTMDVRTEKSVEVTMDRTLKWRADCTSPVLLNGVGMFLVLKKDGEQPSCRFVPLPLREDWIERNEMVVRMALTLDLMNVVAEVVESLGRADLYLATGKIHSDGDVGISVEVDLKLRFTATAFSSFLANQVYYANRSLLDVLVHKDFSGSADQNFFCAECILDLCYLPYECEGDRRTEWTFVTDRKPFEPPSTPVFNFTVVDPRYTKHSNSMMSVTCGAVFKNVTVTICDNKSELRDRCIKRDVKEDDPVPEQVFIILKRANRPDSVYNLPVSMTYRARRTKTYIDPDKMKIFIRRLGANSTDRVVVCIGRLALDLRDNIKGVANCSVGFVAKYGSTAIAKCLTDSVADVSGVTNSDEERNDATNSDVPNLNVPLPGNGKQENLKKMPASQSVFDRVAFTEVKQKDSVSIVYRCEKCSLVLKSLAKMKMHFSSKHLRCRFSQDGDKWLIESRLSFHALRLLKLRRKARGMSEVQRSVSKRNRKLEICGAKTRLSKTKKMTNSVNLTTKCNVGSGSHDVAARRLSGSDMYQCQICLLKSRDSGGMLRHFRRYHPKISIRLSKKGRVFSVDRRTPKYECHDCGQRYYQRFQFFKHISSHENKQRFAKTTSYEYQISETDFGASSSTKDTHPQNNTENMESRNENPGDSASVVEDYPNQCNSCHKIFPGRASLLRHYSLWHGSSKTKVKSRRKLRDVCEMCEVKCKEKFPSRLDLLNHQYMVHPLKYREKVVRLIQNFSEDENCPKGRENRSEEASERDQAYDSPSTSGAYVKGVEVSDDANRRTVLSENGQSNMADMQNYVVTDINQVIRLPSSCAQYGDVEKNCFSLHSTPTGSTQGSLSLRMIPIAVLEVPDNNISEEDDEESATTCDFCGPPYPGHCPQNVPFRKFKHPSCFCGYQLSDTAPVASKKEVELGKHCQTEHHRLIVFGYKVCPLCCIGTFSSDEMLQCHLRSRCKHSQGKNHHRHVKQSEWTAKSMGVMRSEIAEAVGRASARTMDLIISSCEDWNIVTTNQPPVDVVPRAIVDEAGKVKPKFCNLVKIDTTESKSDLCEICGRPDSSEHRFTAHDNVYLPKQWSSNCCGGLFAAVSASVSHVPCRKAVFSCSICPLVSDKPTNFEKHIEVPSHRIQNHRPSPNRDSQSTENEVLVYRCHHCPRSFTSKMEHLRHGVVHEVNLRGIGEQQLAIRSCNVCDFKYYDSRAVKLHSSLHACKQCPYCPCQFQEVDFLQKHLFQWHSVPEIPHQYQNCGFCGLSSQGGLFSRRFFIKTCDMEHVVAKKCRSCDASFSTQTELARHLYLIHKEQRRTHCRRCNVWFPTRYLLLQHWKTHCLGFKSLRFRCSCGIHFRTRQALLIHKCKRHIFLKANRVNANGFQGSLRCFRCSSCPRKFKYQHQLKLHGRIAHKDTHTCHKCKLNFTTATKLQKHQRSFHGQLYFQCHHCQARIRSGKVFKAHWISHHYQYYHCKACMKSFEFAQDLEHHQLSCIDTREAKSEKYRIECFVCKLTFSTISLIALEAHWNQHTVLGTPVIADCSVCAYTTSDGHSDIYRHMTEEHPDKFHRCDRCHMDFTHRGTLEFHREYCELVNDFDVAVLKRLKSARYCVECNLVFIDFVKAGSHTLKTHLKVDAGSACFACAACKLPFQTRQISRSHHKKSHFVAFVCRVCGVVFGEEHFLDKHMKAFHTDTRIKCEHCGLMLRTAMALEKHSFKKHRDKLDSSVVNYLKICEICGKEMHSNTYVYHSMQHAERRFKCTICEATFVLKHHLQNHMKSHEARQFTCEECDMKFRLKHHLESHQRSYHGKAGYKCRECGEEFKLRWKRTNHRREEHGIMSDDCSDDEDGRHHWRRAKGPKK